MQRHKKLSARILSMALTVAMVATMMPATVFAAEGDVPLGASSLGASSIGTVQSFDKLEDRFEPSTGEGASKDVYALNVELNTPFEDLNLPDELTGVVARTTTVSAPAEDEPVVDSGKPSEPAENEVVDEDTDDTVSGNQPASPSDAKENEEIPDEDVPLAPEPEDEETTVTTTEQETVPVTWNSNKAFKSDENGKFIYTAVLPKGYILADGVELPQIYVYVGMQARAGAVYDCEIDLATVSTSADGYTVGSQTLTLTDSSKSYRLYGNGSSNIQMVSSTGNNKYNITLDNVTITSKPGERAFFINRSLLTLLDGSTNTLNSSGETTTMRVERMDVQGTGSLSVTASGADANYGIDATLLGLSDGATVTATSEGNTNWSAGVVLKNAPSLGEGTSLTAVNQKTAIKFSNPITSIPDTAITGAATVDGELSVAAISTDSSDAGKLIRMGQDGTGAITQKVSIVYGRAAGDTITIDTQPTSPAAMTYGSITGNLTVAGTASDGSTVSYQWYQNTTGSIVGGTEVTDATSESFTIPTTLGVGTYYYYCILKATGCADKESEVAIVTVNKANATDTMKTVAATVSKNGATGATATLPAKPAAATYGTITYSGTITCSNASVNGDTLTYTAPASTVGDTGTITIPVTTATNYNDYDIVVTITSTDKKTATITAAVADKTYNGVAVTQPTPTAVEKDTTTPVTLTYTYKWQKSNESGVYTDISGNTSPKDAGSYKLVIDGSNDTHAGKTEITFTISKATVTITADNKSAYVGDAKPTLTYTAAGLASGDTLETVPTLTYESEPDMSTAGSAKIKASGAVVPNTDNYESVITYVDGTLTISNKSSGGGGSSSGGGGSSSTTTPTKPTEPVTGNSNTTATVDKNGNATTTVTDKNIADAVQAAKDAANKKGVNAGEITAVINVTAPANSNPNTVTVNLPKTVQQQVINNKIDNVAIVIDKPDISIGMNLATIKEMNKQANADIALSATRTDATKLSTEAKNAIGNRPAFDLKATYNSGAKSITSFGSGSVSVAIPYTLQSGEVAGGLYAVYIDSNGKANYITGSSYDANTKMLRFATSHFSVYGIGYKAPSAFTDIAGHWAKTDIEFVVNRGLMSGTSNTTFAPNGSMTRGMFVTALGRLAGVDTNSYKTSKFTDVKADAYYAPYVNWATEKGITNGTTATTFSPDNTVTRQEMAVFMSNYAKAMGYKVPETREAVTFADNGSIGSWAAAAVKQMQMAGVLNGKNGNKFDPTGTATRAEVAAVLHRYVELVIDRSTAQGLDTNDSGSAMMYENGKAVKSASRTVGSSTYNFNANGEAALLPADSKKTGTYTVQKGDSFWLIAKKVGCTMAELEQLNGKSRYDTIYAGQTLKVPQK